MAHSKSPTVHQPRQPAHMNLNPVLLASLVGLAALAARVLPGARTIDDAYITFRYAYNLLSGSGLVYNPGEWVLGTTTPVYAALMAFSGFFAGGPQANFPVLALGINIIADILTCWLLLWLGRKGQIPAAGAAAALAWAVLPFSVTFAIGGLETSLFVLLLTATTSAHLAERRVWTAFLAALSLLTRPDALLLLGPLALDRFWTGWAAPWLAHRKSKLDHSAPKKAAPQQGSNHRPNITWGEAAAATVPVLAWFGYATLVYGSPLPHSVTAKSVAYLLPDTQAFVRLLQHYTTPFMENLAFGVPAIWVGVFLHPFLFLVGARRLARTAPRLWPWLLYPWVFFVVFAIANPLIFRWYLTPPLVPYIFTILAGVATLGGDVHSALAGRFKGAPSLALLGRVALVIVPAALALNGWVRQPDHGLTRPAPDMAWYALELEYAKAANLLLKEIDGKQPLPTIAAGDVGVIGYVTRAPILDLVGLNSPQSVRYYPLPPEMHANTFAVAPDLILSEMPDYIVLLEVYGRESLFKNPQFQQTYTLLYRIETDIYGSEGMLIFKKKSNESGPPPAP